ncbi:MAG TPA: FAD-binding oxidoreductase [Steroidobacteraceae bacterium]|nr:FAD-binding oxidoreductase [Steroidobacteraceae bacterium]
MAEFDVVVIGGGIAGVSAAAELAATHRVLLLEREPHLAYHTTGRSAAIYSETYGNRVIRSLSSASRSFFVHPPEGFSTNPLLVPRACLYIGRSDQLAAMEREVEESQAAPCPLERIDAAEAYRLVPSLRPGYVAAAAIERDSADMDVHAIHYGFQRMALSRGVEIRRNAEVLHLEREGSRWRIQSGTAANTAHDRADIVVNAAGAWADEVGRLAGARPLGATPMRRTIIIVAPPENGGSSAWPAVMDVGEEFYFKPEGSKLWISPADETPTPACDVQPDEMDIAVCVDRIERALDFPITRIERSWAGLRTFCPDRTPAVGFDAQVPGFFWLAGQGGYGIQTAPAMARVAATLARGDALSPDLLEFGVDARALDPARFR